MEIELIFEERIFAYHEKYSFNGYTVEDFEKERPDFLIVDFKNHLPNIGDLFIWGDIQKPERASDKQWEILKEYSYKVEARQIFMDGHIALNLLII